MSDVLKLAEDWQWDMLLEKVKDLRAKGMRRYKRLNIESLPDYQFKDYKTDALKSLS